MLLTIGLLFTNKDLKYLKNILQLIKNRVKDIEYEVILFDNRDSFEDDISFLKDYTVLNTGNGNLFQIVSRKKIIEIAKGDYIWFLDVDDEIFEIDKDVAYLLKEGYDSYVFSYNEITSDGHNVPYSLRNNLYIGDIVKPECNNTVTALWNKITKTEVLKNIIKYIPDSARISFLEDSIYVYGILKFSKTQYQSSIKIYTYNALNSSSSLDDYSFYFTRFEKFLIGIDEAFELLDTILDTDDYKALGLNIRQIKCQALLQKVLTTKRYDIKQKMLKCIQQHFTEALIKETYKIIEYPQYLAKELKNEFTILMNSTFKLPVEKEKTLDRYRLNPQDRWKKLTNTTISKCRNEFNVNTDKVIKDVYLGVLIVINNDNFSYLDKCISEIKEKVHLKKELFIIDTRNIESKTELKYDFIKVIDIKSTLKFSNFLIVLNNNLNVKLNYVWFVDPKDEILEVNDNLGIWENIVCFDVSLKEKSITKNIFTKDTYELIQPNLYNKWIHTSLLFSLPKIFNIWDETLVSLYLLNNAESLRIKPQKISNKNISLDKVDYFTVVTYITSRLSNLLQIKYLLYESDPFRGYVIKDLCFSIIRLLSKLEPDDYDKALSLFTNNYSYKEILDTSSFISELPNNHIFKNSYLDTAKFISKNFLNKSELFEKMNKQPNMWKELDNKFVVEMDLGEFCNFRCSYCYQGQEAHKINDTQDFLNNTTYWNRLDEYISKVKPKNNRVYYKALGGEGFLYPLVDIFNKIWEGTTEENGRPSGILVITNGSRRKEIFDLYEWCINHKVHLDILLSFHEEFMDINKFISLINEIKDLDELSLCINTVVHNENIKMNLEYCERIIKETGVYISPLIKTISQVPTVFTKSNEKLLSDFLNKHKKENSGSAIMYLRDGTEIKGNLVSDLEFGYGKRIPTKNTVCDIVRKRIAIHKTGDLIVNYKGCVCNLKIGTLKEDKPLFVPNKCLICPLEFCNCEFGNKLIF